MHGFGDINVSKDSPEAGFTSTVFIRIFSRKFYFLRKFGIHVNFVDI